jgi:hypothetical protein
MGHLVLILAGEKYAPQVSHSKSLEYKRRVTHRLCPSKFGQSLSVARPQVKRANKLNQKPSRCLILKGIWAVFVD